jgi:hypothetical protein
VQPHSQGLETTSIRTEKTVGTKKEVRWGIRALETRIAIHVDDRDFPVEIPFTGPP